ncbi:hypothetical protein [Prevotella sp. MA2016]|uniref:hypothetical protein n=1 Tax=Prevotella sp. MA2016 TaxID=1408310 RepID=UPI00056218FF|nr:hypothetical protein [Prevotella sp. MA2016]
MDVKTKRHMASWLLLAVFVPMVLISSLHVHSNTTLFGDECNECIQHHCHGHIAQQTMSVHECVLCQFLTLPMLVAAFVAIVLFDKTCKTQIAHHQSIVYIGVCGITTLRAPPAV